MKLKKFKESIRGKLFYMNNWIDNPTHVFTTVMDIFLDWLYSQGYEIVKKRGMTKGD